MENNRTGTVPWSLTLNGTSLLGSGACGIDRLRDTPTPIYIYSRVKRLTVTVGGVSGNILPKLVQND